ncbi:MAG: DUF4258 domain-containing protein [Methanoregula sp.]|nr:DUF4258 domain-containing protein [Methanoregula sp.]
MKQSDRIAGLIESGEILISHHARVRMFERNVSTDDLIAIISSGEIIEEYLEDEPCPSVLIMGFIDAVAYHTVIALCSDHIRVITVYIPERDKWIEYRKRRSEP